MQQQQPDALEILSQKGIRLIHDHMYLYPSHRYNGAFVASGPALYRCCGYWA